MTAFMTTTFALLLVLVLVVVPGLALQRLLRPSAGLVQMTALAPAVSLGLVWLIVTTLALARAPVSISTVIPLVAVVAVAAELAASRSAPTRQPRVGLRIDAWDRVGLLAGPAVALAIWCITTQGLTMATPNDDGAHHGLFTARILATLSIDADQVLVGDVLGAGPTLSFYPLGIHSVAALVAASGVGTAVALNATWIVVSSISITFGMFALARRTLPGVPRAAVPIAVLAPLMPQLPYAITSWGGIALIVGMSLVPGVVDAALEAGSRGLGTGERYRLAVLIGIACVGVFFAHPTEIVTVALLAACLGLGDRRLRSQLAPLTALVPVGLVAAAILVVAVLPYGGQLSGGVAERASDASGYARGILDTLSFMLTYSFAPVLVLGLVGAVGIVVGGIRRQLDGWAAYAVVISVVVFSLVLRLPGSTVATAPWYANADRVTASLLFPGLVVCGLGAWWCARTVTRVLGPMPGLPVGRGETASRFLTILLVGSLVVIPTVLRSESIAANNFTGSLADGTGSSLSSPGARAAFDWLARNTASDERVLNEFADGSGWMYAEAGVAPLFAMKVATFPDQWGDRTYLLAHAADLGTDDRAACAAEAWNVRYAYVGGRLFVGHKGSVDPALGVGPLTAGGWTVVFRDGDATVLERPALAARNCATPSVS